MHAHAADGLREMQGYPETQMQTRDPSMCTGTGTDRARLRNCTVVHVCTVRICLCCSLPDRNRPFAHVRPLKLRSLEACHYPPGVKHSKMSGPGEVTPASLSQPV